MRELGAWFTIIIMGSGFGWPGLLAEAAKPEVSISLAPLHYTFLSGDDDKFRAHHWVKENYIGGLKDFSLEYAFPDGTELSAESHALIDQNDLGAEFSLKKDNLGFFKFDYSEFRKYYDKTGGTYYPFTTLNAQDTFKDLALDIGKFGMETGLAIEGMPELTLSYEREFKDGAKSHLNWTAVTEGSTTKNIGPTWQDIDEIVDTFALNATHELAGFALKGEQRWEFVRTETFREEKSLSTNSTASQQKIRRQDQAPQADLMTTMLEGERWFLNEKAFFASAYRFAHLENREFESLNEFDANGNPTNFSNPKQQVNARADNRYNTHTWVGSFMVLPWQWLSVGTKLKSEVIKRESNSSYPADTVPNSSGGSTPNGVIDRADNSLNDTKAVRWGEGFSIRFTGLPRTALYTELELEQSRVLLREDRQSIDGPDSGNGSDANEIFSRETVTKIFRGVWTLGGQFAPWSFLNFTTQVRHRQNNTDYDDQRETDPGSSTAKSAFFDGQSLATNEFQTRMTLKPCQWFRASLRYQLRGDKYATRTESAPIVKTTMLSHIYTYDVQLQPRQDLLTTASFSRQTAVTATPAELVSSATTPKFHADVNTWLFSMDYAPKPEITVANTIQYSWAKDFNDFTGSGLPLGADFSRVDFTTALTWAVTPSDSVKVEYGLYSYLPNSLSEIGGYHAHAIWLEVSKKF